MKSFDLVAPEILIAGLAEIFSIEPQAIEILSRERNVYSSSCPSEIVDIRLADQRPLKLHCKFGGSRFGDLRHAHWDGIEYEGHTYRELLEGSGLSVPRYFGTFTSQDAELILLVIEHLETCVRLNHSPRRDAAQLAAQWLGRFHALSEGRRDDQQLHFLRFHDAEYYGGWARRTLQFAPEYYGECVWLPQLCESFLGRAEEWAASPGPIVHGEFTPHNVLISGSCVYPIDWESAAVGIGETDLATLIDGGWDDEVVRECETAYCQARWPDETSAASYENALTFSRLYVHLRCLGNRPHIKFKKNEWRLPVLEALGQRAGLI